MSAVRDRTPGNVPQTRIYCDVCDNAPDSRTRAMPVWGWDAPTARRQGRELGWRRVGGSDLCPTHATDDAASSR